MSLVDYLYNNRTKMELAQLAVAEAKLNAELRNQLYLAQHELFWYQAVTTQPQPEMLDPLPIVREHIERKYGSYRNAAEPLSVSASMLCKVLAGERTAPKHVLADAGIERITVYRRKVVQPAPTKERR